MTPPIFRPISLAFYKNCEWPRNACHHGQSRANDTIAVVTLTGPSAGIADINDWVKAS